MKLEEVLKHIINSGSDFAVWQLPNSSITNGIVSLRTAECRSANIEEDEGFIISKFNNNDSYYLIKNDINFSSEEQVVTFKKGNLSQLTYNQVELPVEELAETSKNAFIALVDKSIQEINNNLFDKVVISKFRDIQNNIDNIAELFSTLKSSYPNAMVYLTRIKNNQVWIGATPETLLSYDKNKTFSTVALAGTQAVKNMHAKEATWGIKEIEEQAFVSRYIIDCFKKIRLRQYTEKGPKTIQAGNLFHLNTTFTVQNKYTQLDNLAQKMLDLLHPTSAVCGMPLRSSKDFILENEKHDRSFYSGYLGPINFDGDTSLFVNLRCAKVYKNKLRLFAGAGITEDSIAEKEWLETEMKCNIIAQKLN